MSASGGSDSRSWLIAASRHWRPQRAFDQGSHETVRVRYSLLALLSEGPSVRLTVEGEKDPVNWLSTCGARPGTPSRDFIATGLLVSSDLVQAGLSILARPAPDAGACAPRLGCCIRPTQPLLR
jgi:hypothetical protein